METYKLLDSGDLQKLEIVGKYKIIRPSFFSVYKKTDPSLWKNPDAIFSKTESGGGWKYFSKIPESFSIEIANLTAKIKFTPFGHLGIFPEQEENWNTIRKISEKKTHLEVLNLFAYSGISTLSCLDSGHSVCHVDASKGMVEWARENAKLSGLIEKKVRWIVDDVFKFLKREIKRGKKYNAFILDPPSFGRGTQGEVWKIEEDLVPLFELCMQLCEYKPELVILSCHTNGFSPKNLERILQSLISSKGSYFSSELVIKEKSGRVMPSGSTAHFYSG